MSPCGRSERMEVLRDAVGRIASGGACSASFDDRPGRARGARVPLGGESLTHPLGLDRALRGGLGRGALHEIVAAAPGDAGAACGFALALALRCAGLKGSPGTIVWIVEDAARAEHGAPYAPGLVAHGLDLARLVVVSTGNARDSLWAMEEALKARVGAVVADIRRLASYDLVASRRLVLAAQKGATPGLLVAAGPPGLASRLCSAAATRFEVKAGPGPALPSAGRRMPLPGPAACTVRLARIRAGPGAVQNDPDRSWPLLWDHAEHVFRDALPLAPPAPAFDRPPAPALAGRRAA